MLLQQSLIRDLGTLISHPTVSPTKHSRPKTFCLAPNSGLEFSGGASRLAPYPVIKVYSKNQIGHIILYYGRSIDHGALW
jgi:hypothetical protein